MLIATDSAEHADWLARNAQNLLRNSMDDEVIITYKPTLSDGLGEGGPEISTRFEQMKQGDLAELSPSFPQ